MDTILKGLAEQIAGKLSEAEALLNKADATAEDMTKGQGLIEEARGLKAQYDTRESLQKTTTELRGCERREGAREDRRARGGARAGAVAAVGLTALRSRCA